MPKLEDIPKEWASLQMPEWIPESEVRQVSPKIEEFCNILLTSEAIRPTMEDLVTRMERPLKCYWMCPGTHPKDSELSLQSLPTDAFSWIVLLCPSDEQSEVQGEHVWYVQGSADDEETWAQGLTAQLFWKHKEALLENEDELAEKITTIVANKSAEAKEEVNRHSATLSQDAHSLTSPSSQETLDNSDLAAYAATFPMEEVTWIVPNMLAISSASSTCIPSVWCHFDLIINCSSMEYEVLARRRPESKKYMRLVDPFEKGNNVKFKLSRRLPGTLEFVRRYWRTTPPTSSAIMNPQTGSDQHEAASSSSSAVSTQPPHSSPPSETIMVSRPLLIHGLDAIHITIGLAIGILVENFGPDGVTLLPSARPRKALSKMLIKQSLLKVSKFVPEQLPSVMIADLNRYFLSTPEPGVAEQQAQLVSLVP